MLDTYNEWCSLNPINQEELEPLSEFDQLQEDYLQLRARYNHQRNKINELINQLEGLESQTYVFNKLKQL
jgi:predicted nuclease with TOPRIM domain